jgi:hypothetical protein
MLKERINLLVFPSPVGLNRKDFSIKEPLDKILEVLELLEKLRFVLEHVDPCKFTIVINEANIILKTTNRITHRSPYIRKMSCKGSFEVLV